MLLLNAKLIVENNSLSKSRIRTHVHLFLAGETKAYTLRTGSHHCREIILTGVLGRLITPNYPTTLFLENPNYRMYFCVTIHGQQRYSLPLTEGRWDFLGKDDLKFLEMVFSRMLFCNADVKIKRRKNLSFKVQYKPSDISPQSFTWKNSLALLILRHPDLFIKHLITLKGNPEFILALDGNLKLVKEMVSFNLLEAYYENLILKYQEIIDTCNTTTTYAITQDAMLYTVLGLMNARDKDITNNTGIASIGSRFLTRKNLEIIGKWIEDSGWKGLMYFYTKKYGHCTS